MKKYSVLIVIGLLIALNLRAQPVLDPEPVVDVVLKKLDAQTIEVKTTTTTVQTVSHDKAVLQTELDHIPGRIIEIQERAQEEVDALNERAVALQQMVDFLK